MAKKKRKKKAAKTPPPRKAKRTAMVMPSPGRPSKTVIEAEMNEEDKLSFRRLRQMAGQDYATDIEEQKSVSELHRLHPYNTVSLVTMQQWSARDGWVEKRRNFFEMVRKRAEAKLGTALVQARFKQLNDLSSVKDVLLKKVITKAKKDALEAKSLEGVATAYLKTEMAIDMQREKLADAVIPEPAANLEESALPVVRPRLSQEEAAAAALTIVRMRREQMRAAMRPAEEGDEEEKKPHMRLIEGEK